MSIAGLGVLVILSTPFRFALSGWQTSYPQHETNRFGTDARASTAAVFWFRGLSWLAVGGHPTKPNRRLGSIWLKDQALATSGSGKQFFHHQGRRYGHVIDPRTGWP